MKHKVGDKVRIIDNTCSHQFKLGDIVEITDLNKKRQEYLASGDDGAYWFLKEVDCEAVVEKPAPPTKLKVLGIKNVQSNLITSGTKLISVEDEDALLGKIEAYVTYDLKVPKVSLKIELTVEEGIVGGIYIDEHSNTYTCLSKGSVLGLDIDGKDYKAPEELVLISLVCKEG